MKVVSTREDKLLQDGGFGVEVRLQPQESTFRGRPLLARLEIGAPVGADVVVILQACA